jgi:CHRD domain-containing protein
MHDIKRALLFAVALIPSFSLLMGLMAALSLPVPAANAATITLVANLTGALEVPPTGSPGTGQATVLLDTSLNTMEVKVTFSGLEAGTTASHIHCCLSSPLQTGVSVMVATTTPTFPGFPLGATSGTYDMTFNLLDATTYNPLFITSAFNPGGTVASAAAVFVAALLAGETYLNIHTTMFLGGEIRGFLVPTPLPATLPLFATGFGVLGLLGWRKKRKAV